MTDTHTASAPPGPSTAPSGAPPPEALPLVGRPGCPIRAVALSSGGFDAAMQLGVAHALMVIEGKPPDAVVGISIGAVNAVAIAEVLQAGTSSPPGPPPSPPAVPLSAPESRKRRARIEARVRRFREILDAYQRAPSELAQALLPDPFQVEATRPLEPLKLPIHHERERAGRQYSVESRAGLIKLYNDLLQVRLEFGTLAKAVRRGLGVFAAGDVRPGRRRALVFASELAHLWPLIGFNLFHMAPLLRQLVAPMVSAAPRQETGATAAELIFRSTFWRRVGHAVENVVSSLILGLLWLGLSVAVPGLLALAVWGLAEAVGRLHPSLQPLTVAPAWSILLVTYGLIVTSGLVAAFSWRRNWHAVRQVLVEFSEFVVLVAIGVAAVAAAALGWEIASDWRGWDHALASRADWWARGWQATWRWLAGIAAGAVLLLVLLWRGFSSGDYARRLLARYSLSDGLFSENPLRHFIVQVLDPGYYGNEPMDHIVERALRDDASPATAPLAGKTIGSYARVTGAPIHVGLSAANVRTGRLEVFGDDVRVAEGLLAATAVAPLLRAQPVAGELYVDGANISGEATHLLIDFLRPRVHPQATVVHAYTVVPLPFARGSLGGPERPYLTLMEVVSRARQLQRFRDAALERRLTELFTETIPPAAGIRMRGTNGKEYLRAWVSPIEPEGPLEITRQLFAASDGQERRDLIARSVADGCRAALEVMIRPSLDSPPEPSAGPTVLLCREAVRRHLERRREATGLALPVLELPGRKPETPNEPAGPGLREVCEHCVLQCPGESRRDETLRRSIRVHPWATMAPAWPHELEPDCEPATGDPHFAKAPTEYEQNTSEVMETRRELREARVTPVEEWWPRARRLPADGPTWRGTERPLVALLFSGGVFRGVYQMGVLSALSEAGLQPDIVAGASVGSITAAMVAESFSHPCGPARDGRVARLAATFLGLDRLILTDRFADFIRSFTIRAATTRFSVYEADRFFRRYDAAGGERFGREARAVVAGLERLFYVSPFELLELVKALRLQRMPEVHRLLHHYLQEWLDRMGCGNQILGAEPLALLITEHVLPSLRAGLPDDAPVPLDAFLKQRGIYFLATATNLTTGRLELLGEQQFVQGMDETAPQARRAVLLESLLASSAFPGVFRPRWSWEVVPTASDQHQYIDGGVMDNLPLDAVAQFLHHASRGGLVARRPVLGKDHVPHLLFAASLERRSRPPGREEVSAMQKNWPALQRRATQLRYNRKLEGYASAQRSVRAIVQALPPETGGAFEPVDLEVMTVIPRWLCGTFGFHPMLGFRRARQAESIAHGCASTLVELGRRALDQPAWASGWGIDRAAVPGRQYVDREDPLDPLDAPAGRCWLRPHVACPFSRERVEPTGVPARTVAELEQIHLACRRRSTHGHDR
jgi:predicted acylesterase/phospholipase RssA